MVKGNKVEQNYLIIENNIVTNIVDWDGNTNTWKPPSNSIQLIQKNVPAMVWELNLDLIPPSYVLEKEMGVGGIDYTWDGSVLTTNEPQPQPPTPAKDQAVATGLQIIGE